MRYILFIHFFSFALSSFSAGIKDAYQCLKIYDYFKAKEIFQSKLKSDPIPAYYGLSIIYSRGDNPFTQYDSAYRCIRNCQIKFEGIDSVQQQSLNNDFSINRKNIDSVLLHITQKGFEKFIAFINQKNLLKANDFLNNWHDHLQFQMLINLRDSLALYSCHNTTSELEEWLKSYPQSEYRNEAIQLYQNALYRELCAGQTVLQYHQFIELHPKNPNVQKAQEEILKKEIAARNAKGLLHFIHKYPNYTRIKEVWKEFFILSVDRYTPENLQGFLDAYPACPLKEEILEELNLMNLVLWPVYNKGLFGYADTAGQIKIPCIYSGAENFTDGWAQVSDSVHFGFINKAGKVTIPLMYDEAGSFYQGVARVLLDGSFYLINRNNEKVAGPFQELGDFYSDRAVCKRNDKWGAINKDGELVIDFKFEHLGDFSEGLAPASLYGRYGYIEINGFWAIENVYEWAGEFQQSQAKIKLKGKFGIIDNKGQSVIKPQYDLISDIVNNHYLVVQNNFYGIYHRSGCIVREPKYLYSSGINASDIIGKNHLRLIYRSSENLSDYNGNLIFETGEMESVQLPKGTYVIGQKLNKNVLINIKSLQVVYARFDEGFLLENGKGLLNKNGKTWLLKNQKIEEFDQSILDFEVLNPALIRAEVSGGILLLKEDFKPFNSELFDKAEIWQNQFVLAEKGNRLFYYRLKDGKLLFQSE